MTIANCDSLPNKAAYSVPIDSDYIGLAKQGIEHAGIIFVPGRYRDIGVMVEYLRSVYVFYSLDDMENRLEYLSIL